MTDHPEREPTAQPAPSPAWDGWWDKIIEAALEELDGPEGDQSRGPGKVGFD